VDAQLLDPRETWASKEEYDATARDLAQRFHENFKRFSDAVPPEVERAGPA
jgi:phosphoenolpyruvate carboxykinase (ATP)